MPIIKAAVKHLRQSEKRRKINKFSKNRLKESFKEMIKLAKQGSKSDVEKKMPEVFAIIDKAVKNHFLHKNNAARKKSRLAHLLSSSK